MDILPIGWKEKALNDCLSVSIYLSSFTFWNINFRNFSVTTVDYNETYYEYFYSLIVNKQSLTLSMPVFAQ
jgi:hypothetical protein